MDPTDPDASLPIIATEMTFDALPTLPVAETLVISCEKTILADIVPTDPDDELPEMSTG